MSWPRGAAAALPLLAAAAGELVLDARVGVCGFVFDVRAGRAGRRGRAAGGGSSSSPSAEHGRSARFPGGEGGSERAWTGGGVAREGPGGGAAPLTLCVLSCFSLPRSRFSLCGGRRDHKGLTHTFNPPPKSKWPVWCLLHPPPPSLCPFLCLTLMSPALLFPGLGFGAAGVWGNALSSSSSVPHAQSSGRPGISAPHLGGACSWESDLPQQNLGDSVRPLGPLGPLLPDGVSLEGIMQILLSGVHSAAISCGEKFSLLCEGENRH